MYTSDCSVPGFSPQFRSVPFREVVHTDNHVQSKEIRLDHVFIRSVQKLVSYYHSIARAMDTWKVYMFQRGVGDVRILLTSHSSRYSEIALK